MHKTSRIRECDIKTLQSVTIEKAKTAWQAQSYHPVKQSAAVNRHIMRSRADRSDLKTGSDSAAQMASSEIVIQKAVDDHSCSATHCSSIPLAAAGSLRKTAMSWYMEPGGAIFRSKSNKMHAQ